MGRGETAEASNAQIRQKRSKRGELLELRCVIAKVLVQRIGIKNKTAVVLRAGHHTAVIVIAEPIQLHRFCDGQ